MTSQCPSYGRRVCNKEVAGVMAFGPRSQCPSYGRRVCNAVDLIGGVLLDAAMAKKRGGEGLSQNTEVRLSALVESVLRTCGEVRIVRAGEGWEEVGDGA